MLWSACSTYSLFDEPSALTLSYSTQLKKRSTVVETPVKTTYVSKRNQLYA